MPDAGGRDPRALAFRVEPHAVDMVNVSMLLRRPLLVTGKPGTGKSSLAYSVADELRLGPVLRWSITSRSALQQALYQYDAVGRLYDTELAAKSGESMPALGRYLTLQSLGTALLPSARPRVLLVDEIDKADLDLPNDLLDIFEEGEFLVPELQRLGPDTEVTVPTLDGGSALVRGGHVRCTEFPFVVLTSNGEREFPPAFLRRCVRLEMSEPSREQIGRIVAAHIAPGRAPEDLSAEIWNLIDEFLGRRSTQTLATDQLLNAIFLLRSSRLDPKRDAAVLESVLRSLTDDGAAV